MDTDDDLTAESPDNTTLALFEERAGAAVRRAWHDGRWFFSVIDVVGLLTDAPKPRQYWYDMKRYVHDEGFRELSAKIRQLKMPSADGKLYTTDAADTETLLRLVQSIPSPKAEPFKRWLAKAGAERLREEAQPSLAVERLRALYRKKGYADQWIERRLEKIGVRTVVTTEWSVRGAREDRDFAVLTDTLSTGTFDITTSEHKAVKGLTARQNLQDSMTVMELALSSLAEATAATLHQERDSKGVPALRRDASEAGEVGGAARRDVEARTGKPVVSTINYKQLQQERARELQPRLLSTLDDGDDA
jgi:DNA-damage-inducible protein D